MKRYSRKKAATLASEYQAAHDARAPMAHYWYVRVMNEIHSFAGSIGKPDQVTFLFTQRHGLPPDVVHQILTDFLADDGQAVDLPDLCIK